MDSHGQVVQPIGWEIIRSADSIRMDLISETNLCNAFSHLGTSCRVGGVGASNSEFELQIFAQDWALVDCSYNHRLETR